MDAVEPVADRTFCSVCTKNVLRPRNFLLEGVVTLLCSKCAKKATKVSLGKSFCCSLNHICVRFDLISWFSHSIGDEHPNHIVCKECCEIFTTKRALKRHVKSQHSSERSEFPCSACDKKYSRKEHLDFHFKQQHRGATISINSGWVLIDQEISNDAGIPTDMELENDFMPDLDEYPSSPSSLGASYDPTVENSRERKTDNALAAPDNVWTDIQVRVSKLPQSDQAEIKMAIVAMVDKKELAILKRNAARAAKNNWNWEKIVYLSDATETSQFSHKRRIEWIFENK